MKSFTLNFKFTVTKVTLEEEGMIAIRAKAVLDGEDFYLAGEMRMRQETLDEVGEDEVVNILKDTVWKDLLCRLGFDEGGGNKDE